MANSHSIALLRCHILTLSGYRYLFDGCLASDWCDWLAPNLAANGDARDELFQGCLETQRILGVQGSLDISSKAAASAIATFAVEIVGSHD